MKSLWVWRRQRDEDIDAEISAHLEMSIRDRIARGESPADARANALREFGNVGLVKDAAREMWRGRMFDRVGQDLSYGVRMLSKHPGFSIIAILTLALGIGFSTAIFSLTYSLLLRALPYPAADRLVTIWLTNTAAMAAGYAHFNTNAENWLEWRSQSTSFEDIALVRPVVNFNLTGDGRPERAQGAQVSWNLTRVLGVTPQIGRMFTAEEAGSNARLVVLSDGFWTRRFARDPGVLGRRIQLNGEAYEVIGALPPQSHYPHQNIDVLTPLYLSPEERRSPMHFYYRALGRLKAGVSAQQAQSETSAIAARLSSQRVRVSSAVPSQDGTLVEPLLHTNIGQFRKTLYVLLAAVGCLLLIGCINLGGLFVVRANARTHEFAIRAALGASRGRLRWQSLAEVLPLSLLGAGVGAALAWALLNVLARWLPPTLPGVDSSGLHQPALAFALGISLLVVLLAGVLPARLATRVQLTEAIKRGGRTVASGGALRNTLVIAQIAVTLVLVFAGGLLVRSLVAVLQINPGFSPQGVLTMQLQLTRANYRTEVEIGDYYHRLVARVKTIPGVLEAGIGGLPFSSFGSSGGVEFAGKPTERQLAARFHSATPGFLAALGIPLLRGRDFNEFDKDGAPQVAIIDEELARQAFGDTDPVGQRLRFGAITQTMAWVEIVGVVGHIHASSLETDPSPQLYWPAAQPRLELQSGQYIVGLAVRTIGKPESYSTAIIDEIQKENPDQPVYDVRTMSERVAQSLQARRLMTGLIASFGGAAILLACLGLYGVVSYGTAMRSREFAIRTALGAQRDDVCRLVLWHAIKFWLAGSVIGLSAAWPVGQALRSQLHGVGGADAVALSAAIFLMLLTALLAGIIPARRATKIDPLIILRAE